MRMPVIAFFGVLGLVAAMPLARGEEQPSSKANPPTQAERGYRAILDTAFLPGWFDSDTFERVWEVWPDAQRDAASASTSARRRAMTLKRYGLHERPNEDSMLPIQFTVTESGLWTMNCFACHAGDVAGMTIPGAPNTRFAYETLAEDVRKFKLKNRKSMSPFDTGGLFIPLGKSNGTTNAVVFSITLLQFRDVHLNVVAPKKVPRLPHHDLDAPAWWHYKHKRHLYYDGFGKKNARTLMQFTLIPQNKREQLEKWEAPFQDIAAYLESVQAPKWPHAINTKLADQGRLVFKENCARCHGPHNDSDIYPNHIVPIDDVGTDPARFEAITPEERTIYSNSWLTEYDPKGIITNPSGYVAPPLDGIWASAPYLHNGSVPTLWHLLRPKQRPKVWIRGGYSVEQVGLKVLALDNVPPKLTGAQKRQYFDTSLHGKSAAGHTYPAELSEAERVAILEFLKTL